MTLDKDILDLRKDLEAWAKKRNLKPHELCRILINMSAQITVEMLEGK